MMPLFRREPVSDEALASELRAAAMKILHDWKAGRIKPGEGQSTADVFASVVAGVGEAIQMARVVDATRLVISHRRLEPVQIPVDDRGRAIPTRGDDDRA